VPGQEARHLNGDTETVKSRQPTLTSHDHLLRQPLYSLIPLQSSYSYSFFCRQNRLLFEALFPVLSLRTQISKMRLPRSPADAAILSTLLFPFFSAAAGIDCTHVRVDKTSFDLSKLGGARSALHTYATGGKNHTATYTIDICKPLGKVKDVPSTDQCPHGTRGELLSPRPRASCSRATFKVLSLQEP
jgi:Autophagy-related protein 27